MDAVFKVDFKYFYILPSICLHIEWKEFHIDWLGFHFKLEWGCF